MSWLDLKSHGPVTKIHTCKNSWYRASRVSAIGRTLTFYKYTFNLQLVDVKFGTMPTVHPLSS
jgi:hypothetical protein